MATETVRLPTGERVQVEVPEGLSDQETAQFLQRAIPEIQASMPRRTTPQPDPAETGPAEATARDLGRVSAQDLSPLERRIEAFRGGLGSAAFGIDVPISAIVANIQQRLQGENVPFSESLEFARGRKQAVRQESPGADVAGMAAGTVPAVATAIPRRGAQLLGEGTETIRRLLGGQSGNVTAQTGAQGGRVSQAARAAGTGAAAGGTQTLLEEGDAAPGAVAGGVVGPVATEVVRAASAVPRVARQTRDFFTGNVRDISPGINALARRLRTDPDVLRNRFETMRQDLGRPPMMIELLDDLEAQNIGRMARRLPGRIGEPVLDAVRGRSVARQADTAEAIRGGRRDVTPESARVAQGEMADRQFGAFADTPIEVDQQLRDFLEDPATQAAIGGGVTASGRETARELRGRMLRALDGDGTITAQDLEDIRQAASVPEVAQEARAILTQRIPDAEQALQSFARRAQRIEGIEAGRPLIRTGRSRSPVPGGREQDLEDVVARGRAPEQAGVRRGARTELARGAEESPGSALRTVRTLAESEGTGQRVQRIFQPEEAQRLRRFGQAETRAAESMGAMSTLGTDQLVDQATDLAATASQLGTLGGAATSGLIVNLREFAGLPLLSARRVATALTDPNRTAEAIQLLQSRNVGNETIARILDELAASAGVVAAAQE